MAKNISINPCCLAKWTEKDRIRPEFSVDGIRLYNFENDRFTMFKVMAAVHEWMRDRYNFVLTKEICLFVPFAENLSNSRKMYLSAIITKSKRFSQVIRIYL